MKGIFGKMQQIRNMKRSNVMTSLNWMCVPCVPAILYIASKNVNNWLGQAAFMVASCILVFYGGMYVFYSLKDPDRLQTEEYNLHSQAMALQTSNQNGQPPKLVAINSEQQPLLGNAEPNETSD